MRDEKEVEVGTSQDWNTMSLARAARVTPQRVHMLCVTEQLPGAARDVHGRWRIPYASGQAYLVARRARAKAQQVLRAVQEAAVSRVEARQGQPEPAS